MTLPPPCPTTTSKYLSHQPVLFPRPLLYTKVVSFTQFPLSSTRIVQSGDETIGVFSGHFGSYCYNCDLHRVSVGRVSDRMHLEGVSKQSECFSLGGREVNVRIRY
ncbi:hypothetical protein J6590_060669 [Homalodisca vitripennis]|nr:hypothetical protein J6590_060669 [Homalodisca vitripennis]